MLSPTSFYTLLRELTAAKNFCLAFSGGLDSSVLLHLFCQLRTFDSDLHLRMIHVNHGLNINADAWAKNCEKISEQYGVEIVVKKINLPFKNKESLEELARKKRYQIFEDLLKDDEVLVTAHHQNDQAETLLLQLFRGAGPKGLASMPQLTTFGKGFLMRPLLTFTRQTLQHYAQEERLSWLEDDSNQNLIFDRNFLRHKLLPLIEARWPTITENLSRSAKHCAQANQYIESQIANLFPEVFVPNKKALFIPKLLLLQPDIQNYLIRYWLQELNLPLPSTKKLHLLQKEILRSREDASPVLCWKGVEVRRYDNHLYAMPPLCEHDIYLNISWNLEKDLVLPNNLGLVRLMDLATLGLEKKDLQEVTIRFRRGGEKCRLKNRKHHHSLKKLFQEWRIPPWERGRIPLLYVGEKLTAIIGYAVCELSY